MSSLQVGKPVPAFVLDAVQEGEFKKISPADYRGRWLVLLFYPLDFTFVCPTELCAFSDRLDEFAALDADICGISVDSQFSHHAWAQRPRNEGGVRGLRFPLLSDLNRQAAQAFGVLNDQGVALRALIIIDPQGVVQHATVNNLSVGRSVDETLRTLSACRFTRENGEVCPADWKPGDATITPDGYGARRYFASASAAAGRRRVGAASEPAAA
jgi:peroxiredoxin (alkyl hydroperoxide reductase subunit C)